MRDEFLKNGAILELKNSKYMVAWGEPEFLPVEPSDGAAFYTPGYRRHTIWSKQRFHITGFEFGDFLGFVVKLQDFFNQIL